MVISKWLRIAAASVCALAAAPSQAALTLTADEAAHALEILTEVLR